MKHQNAERHVMQLRKGGHEPLMVPRQPPESSRPSLRPLDDPTTRQYDEAALGFGSLHHLQLDAVSLRCVAGRLTRVPLIDKRDLDFRVADVLDRLSQQRDLRPVLFVRGRYVQSQQVPSVSTAI